MKNPFRFWSKQPEAPQREPEPSYFDEVDDQAETKRAVASGESRSLYGRPGVTDADDARPIIVGDGHPNTSFARASLSDKIKDDQEFDRRFKSEASREAAMEARDAAEESREFAWEKYLETMRELRQSRDRMLSDRRPPPPEAVLHNKQAMEQAKLEREQKLKEIERDLDFAYAEASAFDVVVPIEIGKVPVERRIGYTPDASQHFHTAAADPTDWVARFNDAAPVEPPGTAHKIKH